jgi:membrane-bound ClpP family serine protease
MCPACLTAAAPAVAGVTSAGGVTALTVKKVRMQNGTKGIGANTGIRGDRNESSKNNVTR